MSYTREVPPVEPNEPPPPPVAGTPQKLEHGRRHRHRHRTPWYRRLSKRLMLRERSGRVLLIVVCLFAVVIVGLLALVFASANRVETALSSFERVVGSLTSHSGADLTLTDFDRLGTSVDDLKKSLSDAKARVAFLQPFASMNSNLGATFIALNAANQVASAASDMLNGLQPALFFLTSGDSSGAVVTQISSSQRTIELLRIGNGQFASADQHLRLAKSQLNKLDLSGVSSDIIREMGELISYSDQLSQINDVLMNAPDILTTALGISGERNYLILSQNNDELRPSGGYLSTYGWISIRNGRITDYNYSPTTPTSPNPPPAADVSQLNIPNWWLRYNDPIYTAWDGSWYADFPSTAKMSMWYYNTGNNPHSPVDGAISIDVTGFQELLAAIGGVVVPGYGPSPVTADNFRTVVYDIRSYGGADLPHKRFVAALYQQIFAQWQAISTDTGKNTLLLQAMLKALQEKHIMMYFSDEQLNNVVNVLGWSGAQATATDHDYLMVADANLGNKSNHSVIRSFTYDVNIQDDGTIQGTTTLNYDYSARTADNDPAVGPVKNGPIDYNTLVQTYLPTGTTLTDSAHLPKAPTIVNNDTNTEFVSQFYIPFDSTRSFQFSYHTKPLVEDLGTYKRYRLLLQKQPGTPDDQVDVQIMLPPNAILISSTPDAGASYYLDRMLVEFRTDLSVDRWIEVVYEPNP